MREEVACLVAQVGDEHALSRLTADALVEQEEHDAVQVDSLGEELLAVLVQQDGLAMAEEKEVQNRESKKKKKTVHYSEPEV